MRSRVILYIFSAASYPLAYFVIVPFLVSLGNHGHGSDPAGRGMAQGYALLFFLGGWTLCSLIGSVIAACVISVKKCLFITVAISLASIAVSLFYLVNYSSV